MSYVRRLSAAEQKAEDARKAGGEENVVFDLTAAMLEKRNVLIVLECDCCGFKWEPGGLSDPARRALLLSCPECAEYANVEGFTPSTE
jgi:hypothetical protein